MKSHVLRMNMMNVSSATDMMFMFYEASSFNQPIGSWDVSNARIYCMFTDATSFNQPLGNWDISGVTDLSSMFSRASSFNQSLENWDVSGVIDMDSGSICVPYISLGKEKTATLLLRCLDPLTSYDDCR